MDPRNCARDEKPIASEGDGFKSSQLKSDSTPSLSSHLHFGSSSWEAQSLANIVDLYIGSIPLEAQSVEGEKHLNRYAEVVNNCTLNLEEHSYDPQVICIENPQVVEVQTLDRGQSSNDPQVTCADNYDSQIVCLETEQAVDNQTLDLSDSHGPHVYSSSNSNNIILLYNGITYYSKEAFIQDYYRQLVREMQLENWEAAGRSGSYDINGPQFSSSMMFATGGSPAVINPFNGLPWRKGANLCRPYSYEGCCPFGTACIFHHPWPPSKHF